MDYVITIMHVMQFSTQSLDRQLADRLRGQLLALFDYLTVFMVLRESCKSGILEDVSSACVKLACW